MIYIFSVMPLLAVAASVPSAWGWGLNWTDVGLAADFQVLSGLGVDVGFHRFSTHGSFRANRGLKIGLAVAGQLALQGPVIDWAADHHRQHAFSDREMTRCPRGSPVRRRRPRPGASGTRTWAGFSIAT